MNKSESIAKLSASLTKFQSEMQSVKKGSVNPFYKSTYADLASIIEAIREPLATNGLAFSQFPSGQNGLTTILMHESGEYIEETMICTPVDSKPQSLGSAITYARRYALGAVLGISTEEDDDGNQASTPKKFSKPATQNVESKKVEIMGKMKQLGIEPVQKTKEGWEKSVKANFDLELVEGNYDKIIEKLNASLA
jgi:hypothetical protein